MSIYIPAMPQPVVSNYDGDTINTRKLQDFCGMANTHLNALANEVNKTWAAYDNLNTTNKRLIQFMNWLAVTNPQILDEFQTTALAFDKLSPRDDGGQTEACAAP